MNRQRRATLTAAVFCCAVLLSTACIAVCLNHACVGAGCAVCPLIAQSARFLAAVFCVAASLKGVPCAAGVKRRALRVRHLGADTLIGRKVELLN